MAHIIFGAHTYGVGENETVLEALLRHSVAVPSSCRSGVCQTCLMRALHGAPPAAAQKGIKDALRERGFFLACSCKPVEDMEVALPGDDDLPLHEAVVIERTPLNREILRLRLRSASPFSYRAGQFLNLHHDGFVRSYSLASVGGEDAFMELHVQRLADGRMSGWLHDGCGIGEHLRVQGPFGDCYYRSDRQDQPLLLIGTGSGLAPLWGIVRDALRLGHRGPIHLFHGGRTIDDLYLVDELRALTENHANFHYAACVSRGSDGDGFIAGRASDLAFARFPKLKDWRVFLCGNAAMVKASKKRAFLAGAALSDIHADPFEFSATPAAPASAPLRQEA